MALDSAPAVLTILALTGMVRLYFNAHYLTDVLGGYGAGLAWTAVALLGVDWYFFRVDDSPDLE